MFLQFFKYNIVGIINTLIGFSIIFLLMYVGVSATLSNMLGYTIGAFISYRLNSQYTFNDDVYKKGIMLKFFMVLGIAYLFNFVTLQWLLVTMNPYIAQLGAAIIYTVSSFIMARYLVFRN